MSGSGCPRFWHHVRHAVDCRLRTWPFPRRRNDLEVDLIVQHADGRVLGIEVKLADRIEDADAKHLHWHRDRIGNDLIDAIVNYVGERAYRRREGIAVMPLFGP